jgi:short-subunit dehydrogenase
MPGAFEGKVVVVTGASMGIGRALALEFARARAHVVVAARSQDKLAEVAREIEGLGGKALVIETDVELREELARMVELTLKEFGRLDVLVNNAGHGVSSFLDELPQAELERVFRVNVHAPVYATQFALPHLQRVGGQVINVGSVIGRRAVPVLGAYCMTKSALAAFSEALRAEMARFDVHVLHVEPGLTATGFGDHRVVVGDHPRSYRQRFVMSAETAARRILDAAARRRDRIVLTLSGKVLILANTVAPFLVNRLLASSTRKRYGNTGGPATRPPPD